MSTRWYPLYQRGNPQLRVFLPNFWLKLVKPPNPQPPNVVMFHCSIEMTANDVQNYLAKIYNVKALEVRTRIQMGKLKKTVSSYITKDDDYKVAYAILDKKEQFVFPDIVDQEQKAKDTKYDKETMKEMEDDHKKWLKANNKPGVPGWFSI